MSDFLDVAPLSYPFPPFDVLDVTLRDGGFRTGFRWSLDEAVSIVGAALASGCTLSELGYVGGAPEHNRAITGPTADISPEFACRVADGIRRHLRIDVSGRLAVMVQPMCVSTPIPFAGLYEAGIGLVRFVYHANWLDKLAALHEQARAARLRTSVNVAIASRYSSEALTHAVEEAVALQPDMLYLADTCGAWLPSDVAAAFTAIRSRYHERLQLGFHAHDHLTLALANSLTALDAGVSHIDATILGIGKSAGNLRLELLLALLETRTAPSLASPRSTDVRTSALLAGLKTVARWSEGPNAPTLLQLVSGAGNFTPPMETALADSRIDPLRVLPRMRCAGRALPALLEGAEQRRKEAAC